MTESFSRIIGHPRNSVFICRVRPRWAAIQSCQGTGFDNMRQIRNLRLVGRVNNLHVAYCISHFFFSYAWRFAADNPSTLSSIICRAWPTAWKPRSVLSEGFLLALWLGSIRIRSAGGILGYPRLVYSLRYSRGGRRGCRLPSPHSQPLIMAETNARKWL